MTSNIHMMASGDDDAHDEKKIPDLPSNLKSEWKKNSVKTSNTNESSDREYNQTPNTKQDVDESICSAHKLTNI